MNKKLGFFLFIIIVLFSVSCKKSNQSPRVIVLGLDGMRPDAIEGAKTPNLHQLIYDGTSTMKARSLYPTSSGANWASMLLGCGPDQHGVDRNDWKLENREITPVFEKKSGYSVSIFDVLEKNNPKLRTSAVLEWFPIANYFDTIVPDTVIDAKSLEETVDGIIDEFINKKADFVFSQIDFMDHAGHSLGFGSEEYRKKAEVLDKEIGRLIKALKTNGLYSDIYIIALADHGGIGFSHGGKSMEEYIIPFIIKGPGIAKGQSTDEVVSTFDIAPIVASIFGYEIPQFWTGSNVTSAFGNNPELLSDFSPKVSITVDSVLRDFSIIDCSLKNSKQEIKYKISKKDKVSDWEIYKDKIKLNHGDTLFATVFRDNKPTRISSFVKPFCKHKANFATSILSSLPQKKYSANENLSLTDGLLAASSSFRENEWLGFQGSDIDAIIALSEKQQINSVTLRFLENVKSWLFLPKTIKIFSSENGKIFNEIYSNESPFKIDNEANRINSFKIDFTEKIETKYLKVFIENYGILPEWHSGAGKNAWLFIDEIIVE